MKKLFCLFLGLLTAFVCLSSLAQAGAAPALSKDLVILYTSDVHCGVDQGWGYAGLYALKEKLSKDHTVLLVDDGDAIQGEAVGTMTRGEAIIDIMNVMGYDLAIPGNHEFDYGMEQFLSLTRRANFPYLCCNLNRQGEQVFKGYAVLEADGVKIGFVGVTTPLTPRSSTARNFMNDEGEFIYNFLQEDGTGQKLYDAVQQAVDAARADGARYVIALAHLGNAEACAPWRYSDVIAHTTGIDAMLDGHSHDLDQVVMKNKDGQNVVRSACGTKLETVGALTITVDGRIFSELYSWSDDAPAKEGLTLNNPAALAVENATRDLNEKLNEVVAGTAVDLTIFDPAVTDENGHPIRLIRRAETNLGDLCADAYLDQSSGADIALINGGGIRVSIDQGDITLNDILSVHPFGNALTVIEATGRQVLDALEWSVHAAPAEFGGFLQVAGLTFTYDPTLPSPCLTDENKFFGGVDETMERRVRDVLVGGEPIDPDRVYRVVSNDYTLLNNGDGYTMFGGGAVLQEAVKLDNQVLIDHITQTLNGVVGDGYRDPYGQGRIVAVGGD